MKILLSFLFVLYSFPHFHVFASALQQNSELINILNDINGVVYMIVMPERKQHAIDSLAALGLYQFMNRVEVIQAIHKESFTPQVVQKMANEGAIVSYENKTNPNGDRIIPTHLKVTPGKLAVWKSHMKAHERFQASNFDLAIFLEDDLMMNDVTLLDNHLRLNMVLKFPPPDFKLIYLGYCFEKCDSVANFNTLTVKNASTADQGKGAKASKYRQHSKSTSSASSPLLASMSTVSNPSALLEKGELPVKTKWGEESKLHVTYRDGVFPRCTHAYVAKKVASRILLNEAKSYSGSVDNMFGFAVFNAFYARRDLVDRVEKFRSIYDKPPPSQYKSNSKQQENFKSNYDDDQLKLDFEFNDLKTYLLVPPIFRQDPDMSSLLQHNGKSGDLLSNNIISSLSRPKKGPVRAELFGPKLSSFCTWFECNCKNSFSGDFMEDTVMEKIINPYKMKEE